MKKKILVLGLSIALCFTPAIHVFAQEQPVYLTQDTTNDETFYKKNAKLMLVYNKCENLTDHYADSMYAGSFFSCDTSTLSYDKDTCDSIYNRITKYVTEIENTSGVYTIDEINTLKTVYGNLTTCKNYFDSAYSVKIKGDENATINYLSNSEDEFIKAYEAAGGSQAAECYSKIENR
ncbi:MAG: hypothetical protein LKJ13_01765 [Clostridia bacterium]|nr:hypothetical protein [Clostridia bacterium]MCI1999005.1 hypothetical protein [Clostridia bacterium]MCI2013755.1 hypothetical protein [Clostridia bacterium]